MSRRQLVPLRCFDRKLLCDKLRCCRHAHEKTAADDRRPSRFLSEIAAKSPGRAARNRRRCADEKTNTHKNELSYYSTFKQNLLDTFWRVWLDKSKENVTHARPPFSARKAARVLPEKGSGAAKTCQCSGGIGILSERGGCSALRPSFRAYPS